MGVDSKFSPHEALSAFHASADALPHMVWGADPSGRIDFVNAAWREYFASDGTDADQTLAARVHREDIGAALEIWNQSVATGEDYSFTLRMRRGKDGEYRWHMSRAKACRDANGQILGWCGTLTNVHHLVQKPFEGLISSVELQRPNAPLKHFSFCLRPRADLTVDREWMSPSFEEITGYKPEELDTLGWDSLVHPDDLEVFYTRHRAHIDPTVSWLEYRLLTRSGEIRFIRESIHPIHGIDGLPRIYGSAVDITELKLSEMRIQESERRFRLLADAMPHLVWTALPGGVFDYFNQRCYEYSGQTEEEAFSNNGWQAVVHPDDLEPVLSAWAEAGVEKRAVDMECRLRNRLGEYRWFLAKAEPVLDNTGEIVKWFGSCTDIEDQKRASQDLLRLNRQLGESVAARTAELEMSNRELAAFCYSVSHDLRAPLRAVDGFAHALAEDEGERLSADGLEYIGRIRAASRKLDELISTMLELSRLTRSELTPAPVDLSSLFSSLVADVSPASRNIQYSIEPGVVAVCDRRLMLAALENLLRNSIKFTSKLSEATIEFGMESKGDRVVYYIKDNGAGFDMRYSDKLFKPFERLHRSGEFPGSGIGLATVQRIIQKHSGEIWATGEVGKGATFFFTL